LSGRITLSTTDEAEAVYNQLENDIENLYGGKSAFWRSCLMNFDDKNRIEAKIELIEQRIEQKKNEIEDLRLQKKGLESELDEMTESSDDKVDSGQDVDDEFWDKTVDLIFKRNSPDEAETLKARWNRWFQGRYDVFENKYREVSPKDFKSMVVQEAEKRGFDTDEVDFL